MLAHLSQYVPLIYILTAIPYAWLGLYAWRKRPAVAVTPFAWAMLGMSIWAFAYGLEVFFPSLFIKLLFVKLEYIGVVSIPLFLFIFSLEFTGRSHTVGLRARTLLWLFSAFFLLLVWTNDYHHLIWHNESVVQFMGLMLLHVDYSPFFWVQISFSYLLVIVGSIIMVMELLQRPGIYRVQATLLVIGILTPWIGSAVFVSGSDFIQYLDVTPLFFIPTAFSLVWAIMRYRLLDVLPLEHLSVLQNMQDGVIVTDNMQRVLYINPVAEKIFNKSEADVIGQQLEHLSDLHGRQLAAYIVSGEARAEIVFGEGRQAIVFEMNVSSLAPLENSATSIQPGKMLALHDITHRKEAELALSRRESIMTAISVAAAQFLRETMWEYTVPGVLEKIGTAADVSHVYVTMNYTNDDGAVHTSLCYEWVAKGEKPLIGDSFFQHVNMRQAGLGRWENLLSQEQNIAGLVRDFPDSEQHFFAETGAISLATVPIFVDSVWWGMLIFAESRNDRHWNGLEMEAFRTTANIFGAAETRARAQQKLIRRQKTLSLLQDIVTEALMASNLRSMAQGLVERMAQLINADGCFISAWNDEEKLTLPLAAYGPFREKFLAIKTVPGENTFTSSALQLNKTMIVEDAYNAPYVSKNIAETFPSRSLIAIPLKSGNKRYGAVLLAFDRLHKFQPEEISIGEQAANLISLAFEKFEAVEQAQRRALTSETLRKASAVVGETLEIKETIQRVLEQLKQVVIYDSASVQLLKDHELEIVGGSGFSTPDAVIGMRFPIPGDNPNSVVMETGEPLLLGDVTVKYKVFLEKPNDHIRSWLGVPLKRQSKTIGLLTVDSGEPNDFTTEDINLVKAFADQVAVALENARVFEESQSQAVTDALTGLYNRRGLFELGHIEFNRSTQFDRPFSGIMIDIDHFKQINDMYGHEVGDKVLQAMAKRCKKCVRDIDIVGRYGGEEIVILLPETDLKLAGIIADRVLDAIASKPMPLAESYEVDVTASLGVASKDENTSTLEVLLNRADQAMYVAKHNGRNRVAHSK